MPAPAPVRVRCNHCQKGLSVPPAMLGKTVNCPNPACGKPITLRPTVLPAEQPNPVPPPVAMPLPVARPAAVAEGTEEPPPSSNPGRNRGLLIAGVAGVAVLGLVGAGVAAVAVLGFTKTQATTQPVAALTGQPATDSAAPDPVAPTPAVPDSTAPDTATPDDGAAPKPTPTPSGTTPPPAPAVFEAARAGLELPPVGPVKAAAGDRVAVEYKTARAAYHDAVKKARGETRVQFLKRREEISKGKPDPKDKALQEYNDQLMAFAYGPGKSQDTGPLPTHPVMATAVADYWKALDDAARKFGEVADKGLAAYEKAGVSDPAKLRPLQAASLGGKNAELLGIWSSDGKADHDVWVVDVDEASGGWRVDGSLNYKKGFTGFLYHAEKIKFADGKLSFEAAPVDTNSKKVKGTGTPASLKLKDGKLLYDGVDARGKAFSKPLVRSGEESARNSIEFWGVPKAVPAEPGSGAAAKADVNDPNYVWHCLAGLSSFPAYQGKSGPAAGEQFFLPYRSKHPTLTPGPYGGLTDMLLGRSPGGGKNQQYAELLFREFDRLADSPHQYLKRAGAEFLALCRARFQLAEADELLGNTPNSSIREFQQNVFLPAGKYVFQREADRAELQNKLEKAFPDKQVIVFDAPMSAASRGHLNDLMKGVGGMMEDVKQRAVVSGLLAYADMAQVDRASALWQTWLVPLAKKCGGPPAAAPLVAVEGDWKLHSTQADKRFAKLNEFKLKNVSGQDLTHAVVELVAENEWGEKAAHYYYFDKMDVAEVARLIPHPRWERRRLPFTNTVKLKWSVWADQGSEVDRTAKLTNPTPNPDPAGWRKDYLDYDRKYQAEGEALGAVVRNFPFLPVVPERQRRRLLTVAAAGTTYAVQLSDKEKPLVVRFLRLDADKLAVELEVFDPAGGKPYRPDTPVWKGSLKADKEAGYVIRLDTGWAIQLAADDQPTASVPKSGDTPAKVAPLVRVKLP